MKIQVVSDLHLEFGAIDLQAHDRDLLVLAGDTNMGRDALPFLEEQLELSPVIYVMGNHEYYDHSIEEINDYWINLNKPDLHVLENRSVTIDGVDFFGCVLWTDMEDGDGYAIRQSRNKMNDYALIRKNGKRLDPKDTMEIHKQSVAWLDEAMAQSTNPKIVITHHMPSAKSTTPGYKGSDINGAYYSELDWLILKHQPNYWLHGHTHSSCEYEIEATRVLCNPRGYYPKHLNQEFDPQLLITIE